MVAPKNSKLICIHVVALLTCIWENESIPKLSSFPLSEEVLYHGICYNIMDNVFTGGWKLSQLKASIQNEK